MSILLFYIFYFLRGAQQPTDTVYGIFFYLSHHLCNFPIQKFSSKTYISEMDIKETKPKICRKSSYRTTLSISWLNICYLEDSINDFMYWKVACVMPMFMKIKNLIRIGQKNVKVHVFNKRKISTFRFHLCNHLYANDSNVR